MKQTATQLILVLLLIMLGLLACRSAGPIGEPQRHVQPVVAVESFANRAPFPLRWDLGEGMAEVLTAALVRSGRFEVVARSALDAVLDELALQHDPRFRDQGKATPGRLKNARYLVRGTVVDFTHTKGGGLHFMRGLLRGRARASVALVTITLEVIELESRQVYSGTFEGRAWAAEASLDSVYRDVSFGGSAFSRTPLGHATEKAIWKAMQWMVEQVATDTWYPLIAKLEADRVYLNGGSDRGLQVGQELRVTEPGEAIVDPATGDILGHTPERFVAHLRISEVAERFAIAEIIDGDDLRIGQSCRPVGSPPAQPSSQ